MHLFLFLFKTLVDLLIIGLMLRIFCSLWIVNTNPIHQAIVLMTNPLIRPLSPYIRNKNQLILLLVGLSVMIKFFSLWFAFSLYCLVGLNLLQLLALSVMTLITFVLKLFFFGVLAHAILSWLAPNNYSPASDFIRQLIVPILRPIQKKLPYPAGLDFSPFIAIVIIQSLIMIVPINSVLAEVVCTNLYQIL